MERYTKSLAKQAVAEYVKVAKKHGMTPTELALAWCKGKRCSALCTPVFSDAATHLHPCLLSAQASGT